MYVGDAQIKRIRRYDEQGQYLGSIGTRGQGPGEFEAVTAIAVRPDGTVVVWDNANRRLTEFTPGGELLSSTQVLRGYAAPRRMIVSQDGDVLMTVLPEGGFLYEEDGYESFWSRIKDDGTDEIFAVVPKEDRSGPRFSLGGRGGNQYPFTVMTLSAVGPDQSVYVMRNDEYSVSRTLPSGETVHVSRDVEQIPVAPDERAEWTAMVEIAAAGRPDTPEDQKRVPDFKPYARAILVDLDGRLWVSRYTVAQHVPLSTSEHQERTDQGQMIHEWRNQPVWDVFDASNDFLTSVILPQKMTLATAQGDQVWGIQSGDFDEDYVVRLRAEGLVRSTR